MTIRNDDDHKRALARVDALLAARPAVGTDEDRELEGLAVLIDAYEKRRWPIAAPSEEDAIAFRVEQMDRTPRDRR